MTDVLKTILVIDQDWLKIQEALDFTPEILENLAEHWYVIELNDSQIAILEEKNIWHSDH